MATTEEQEDAGGLRSVAYLVVVLLAIAAVIALQVRLRGFEGPLSDNILLIVLINANFLLLAAVVFLIARSLWKLSVERRSRVLGAKFRTKLVAAFVSLAFIPSLLMFIIGSGMFTRTIERLFSLRIETSLQDSVTVSQAYYDLLKGQALSFGRQIGKQVSEERLLARFQASALTEYFQRKAAEYELGAVELFERRGASSARVVTERFPDRTFVPTPPDLVGRAFRAEEVAIIQDIGRRGEILRAAVPVYSANGPGGVSAVVVVSTYVPFSLSGKVDEIRAGYSEYRSSFKGRELIKTAYRLGFFAVTLALLLAAIWVALRVSASITVPISRLAEGTVAVAGGNLDYRIEEQSGDEVGMLVESFNRMTGDLKGSNERLGHEIANREIILANIDAGVVFMDRTGRITTINPAACRIMGITPKEVLNKRYDEAFGFIDLNPIRNLFRRLEEGQGRAEEELSLTVRGRLLTLRMRVSTIKDDNGAFLGSVITFDDLTELLRAKKSETWQDVARKIAHEVKNPLTPIKLSAERLKKKFTERSPDFDRLFGELNSTIIDQVDGLKALLDEFADFARLPRPKLAPHRLGPIIEDVTGLYAAAHRNIRFVNDVPGDLPVLMLDPEQMKRVFINLMKNAVEVLDEGGEVRISAAVVPGAGKIRVETADTGPGIPDEDLGRLFEPYFSRKRKGGGLGLAIVERVIADHNGSIHAERNAPQGAKFVIELPVKRA